MKYDNVDVDAATIRKLLNHLDKLLISHQFHTQARSTVLTTRLENLELILGDIEKSAEKAGTFTNTQGQSRP